MRFSLVCALVYGRPLHVLLCGDLRYIANKKETGRRFALSIS